MIKSSQLWLEKRNLTFHFHSVEFKAFTLNLILSLCSFGAVLSISIERTTSWMHALFTLINAIHGSARMSARSRISREFIEMTLSNIIFMCVETIMEHSTCGAPTLPATLLCSPYLASWSGSRSHLSNPKALATLFGHFSHPLLPAIEPNCWIGLINGRTWIVKVHHGILQAWLKHDSKEFPPFCSYYWIHGHVNRATAKHDMQIAGEEAQTVHKWKRWISMAKWTSRCICILIHVQWE